MSDKISLKEIERKTFASVFQDGLVDILLACWVLMFAVGPYLTPSLGDFWGSAVFVPFWAVVALVLFIVRRHVVRPRMGAFKLGSWRRTRVLRFNVVMFVLGVLALGLGVLATIRYDAIPGWMHTARFSLVILIGFGLAGWFLEFARLYLYGALIPLSFLIGEWLWARHGVPHHGYPVTFGVTAGLMLIIGLVSLARLVRDHPLPSNELDSGAAAG